MIEVDEVALERMIEHARNLTRYLSVDHAFSKDKNLELLATLAITACDMFDGRYSILPTQQKIMDQYEVDKLEAQAYLEREGHRLKSWTLAQTIDYIRKMRKERERVFGKQPISLVELGNPGHL